MLGIISYTEEEEFVTSLFVGRGLYIHGGLDWSSLFDTFDNMNYKLNFKCYIMFMYTQSYSREGYF
jgi:hypothetical protein